MTNEHAIKTNSVVASLEGARISVSGGTCARDEYDFDANGWTTKDTANWPMTREAALAWTAGWNEVAAGVAIDMLTGATGELLRPKCGECGFDPGPSGECAYCGAAIEPAAAAARPRELDRRELATVLAALRYWQREGLMSGGHEQDIATDAGELEPMKAEEIDALCERLNIGEEN
ncbi:MAG: hypothetical protein WB562_13150 [Candidatus Sulfotelmatobacter sp.]